MLHFYSLHIEDGLVSLSLSYTEISHKKPASMTQLDARPTGDQ